MQRHIARLAAGLPAHTPPRRDGDLDHFMASLATAWRAGGGPAEPRDSPQAYALPEDAD